MEESLEMREETMMKPQANIEPKYPARLQDLIEDLQALDDAERKTAMLAIDLAYRSGFADGMRLLQFIDELQ